MQLPVTTVLLLLQPHAALSVLQTCNVAILGASADLPRARPYNVQRAAGLGSARQLEDAAEEYKEDVEDELNAAPDEEEEVPDSVDGVDEDFVEGFTKKDWMENHAVTVEAAVGQCESKAGFSFSCYIDNYQDVKDLVAATDGGASRLRTAKQHFKTIGFQEGRICRCVDMDSIREKQLTLRTHLDALYTNATELNGEVSGLITSAEAAEQAAMDLLKNLAETETEDGAYDSVKETGAIIRKLKGALSIAEQSNSTHAERQAAITDALKALNDMPDFMDSTSPCEEGENCDEQSALQALKDKADVATKQAVAALTALDAKEKKLDDVTKQYQDTKSDLSRFRHRFGLPGIKQPVGLGPIISAIVITSLLVLSAVVFVLRRRLQHIRAEKAKLLSDWEEVANRKAASAEASSTPS